MDIDFDAVDLPTAAKTRQKAANSVHNTQAYIINNMPRLIRDESIAFFDAYIESFLGDWTTIIGKTNLPSNIATSDPYVITVFQQLDSTIDAGESIRSRLAHVQIMRTFRSLEMLLPQRDRLGAFQESLVRAMRLSR